MDTTKNNKNPMAPINPVNPMAPVTPDMLEEEKKESKVSKGIIGAGIGVAAAGVGAAAGATVSNILDDEPSYLSDDDEQVDPNDDNNGYYDDDKDLDKPVSPEDKGKEDPDATDPDKKPDPGKDDNGDDNNGGNGDNGGNDDPDPDPDARADKLIEDDKVDPYHEDGEWTPVGWRTITDEDGNEMEAMIFSDGNGGYVALIEGEQGSGIFDVAMNPDTGEMMPINEQWAFTRGDFDSMIEDDGGYLAPGAEDDNLFVDNDDIDKDIIITDDGKLVAERDRDMDDDDTFGVGNHGQDSDDIIEDDLIEDAIDGGDPLAQVDDADLIDDDALDEYLGEDEYAEVNEDTVTTIDDADIITDDMVADNTYVEDTYEEPLDMGDDNFDDGMDMA